MRQMSLKKFQVWDICLLSLFIMRAASREDEGEGGRLGHSELRLYARGALPKKKAACATAPSAVCVSNTSPLPPCPCAPLAYHNV